MKYLILGATGTLGRATIKALGQSDEHEIICLSRDELKLSQLKNDFPFVKTVIADIRDKASLSRHFKDVDTVFHFAALKRIPEMEAQPVESLKTNVIGTLNAAECAIENDVSQFVFSSTDKACLPINVYGASKLLAEKILFSFNSYRKTNFSVYRWANVLSSRGSVIYAFKDAVESGEPAQLTDNRMTRFWIKIEDAVKFILTTYHQSLNEVKVPKLKAAPVVELLEAIGEAMGKKVSYGVTGMRPGEKLHEDITYDSKTGERLSSNNGDQYTREELLELAKEIIA